MFYDFIAIDFETANQDNRSACSIGLVAVKNNNIVETYSTLIKPRYSYFDKKNISIHGITPESIKDAPSFPEVWSDIKDYFNGESIIVAHNATFDMSVLKLNLLDYELDIPDFDYVCSIPF